LAGSNAETDLLAEQVLAVAAVSLTILNRLDGSTDRWLAQ
jgi:hypothetical protein